MSLQDDDVGILGGRKLLRWSLVATIAGFGISGCQPYGADVRVRNVDQVPLLQVEVEVTGATYALGDIPVGETRSVKTYPQGESSLEITQLTPSGERQRFDANVYFEGNYRDIIEVDLTQQAIAQVQHHDGGY